MLSWAVYRLEFGVDICAEPTALGFMLIYDNGLKPVATKCSEPTALKDNYVNKTELNDIDMRNTDYACINPITQSKLLNGFQYKRATPVRTAFSRAGKNDAGSFTDRTKKIFRV